MSLEAGFGIPIDAWAIVEPKMVESLAQEILFILSIHVNKPSTHAWL